MKYGTSHVASRLTHASATLNHFRLSAFSPTSLRWHEHKLRYLKSKFFILTFKADGTDNIATLECLNVFRYAAISSESQLKFSMWTRLDRPVPEAMNQLFLTFIE